MKPNRADDPSSLDADDPMGWQREIARLRRRDAERSPEPAPAAGPVARVFAGECAPDGLPVNPRRPRFWRYPPHDLAWWLKQEPEPPPAGAVQEWFERGGKGGVQ